jgi:hypothetical protein
MRHLAASKVNFDEVELKKLFYSCRKSTTETVLAERWGKLVDMCGVTEKMRKYLQDEIWQLRERWCAVWTNSAFHSMLMSTRPSESFHALLAS